MQSSRKIAKAVHYRLSEICVGASSLRNQGQPGFVRKSREYFYNNINIAEFFRSLVTHKRFLNFLDRHTQLLARKLPGGGKDKNWGSARKGLNLFFRELVYNKILCDYYNLPSDSEKYNKLISRLELPLDKDVSLGIVNEFKGDLPRWRSIKALKQNVSDLYQDAANQIATENSIPRIHLDLIYWRPQKRNEGRQTGKR
jgi:hypothetical protein